MTQTGINTRSARTTGFTAWLALAAVLLLQIGAVAHEAQHTSADIGDVCDVCVQLDSGTVLDSGTANTPAPAATATRRVVWHDANVATSPYCTPQLRAPPALI
ncbi:MAG: DUF2946 family protein [Pseudomonadota bacterium]